MMRSVTVSTSASLACHQCYEYCTGSSLASGIESLGCGMWHFLKLVARGFLWVLWFPPLLHQLMVQPIEKKLNTCDLNSIKLNS